MTSLGTQAIRHPEGGLEVVRSHFLGTRAIHLLEAGLASGLEVEVYQSYTLEGVPDPALVPRHSKPGEIWSLETG